MKMHNLDRLFLITFDEVYLLDYLVSNYGTSILMGSKQARRQRKLSLPLSVYECLRIKKFLWKHQDFLLTRLQVFVTWVSKSSLLFKWTLNSFFIVTIFNDPILIEKGSFVLKTRWHLSEFVFKKCSKTIQKVFFQSSLVLQNMFTWRQHFQNTHTESHYLCNS